MSEINQPFADLLQTIRRPGDFFATGRSNIFSPRIVVDGVGVISLPLRPEQAQTLVGVAEQAPYGRGADTLVDTEVRRTWQIGAEQVHVSGSHWQHSLTEIVGRCATGLGVLEPVAAELYKMLVYETGSFFLSHRDTEKTPGMFATLVLAFPADFSGGELRISHREREVVLDLSCEDASEVAFAAFYADCRHEVLPVTSGYRLVLIYNLVRQGPGKLPQPPAYDQETALASGLLEHWASELAAKAPTMPAKLIYPLEHVYTPAEIGFTGLKNADAAVASVLVEAARRANCELYLALVNIEESGSAEYAGGGYRRYHDDDADFEVGEVFEHAMSLSDWCLPDGSRLALGRLPCDESELCPENAFEDEEPDEEEFFEATGNAGASFERSYRRAALVLWPKDSTLEILAGAGLEVSLPYLTDLSLRWADSGADESSPLWLEAHRLAVTVIARWPQRGGLPQAGAGDEMLSCLIQLEDAAAIFAFLGSVAARGGYEEKDNPVVHAALAMLASEPAASLLKDIIAFNAPRKIASCVDLLERITAASRIPSTLLTEVAVALLAALPGDPARAPQNDGWHRVDAVTPELVSQVLTALQRLDATALGEKAMAQFLAWPVTYPADAILVPAALQLAEDGLRDWPPARRLRDACLAHLDSRIAEPLAPPADFARPSTIACKCQYCLELANFLASADRKQWIFKAAEAKRRHVEASIRQDRCDLDTQTLRHSSPHELVCTKNQASYQRRRAQREADLKHRGRLEVGAA